MHIVPFHSVRIRELEDSAPEITKDLHTPYRQKCLPDIDSNGTDCCIFKQKSTR